MPISFPRITLPQIIGVIFGGIGPVLVLVSVDLNAEQLGAIDDLKFLAGLLIGGDAIIRVGRNLGTPKETPPEDAR